MDLIPDDGQQQIIDMAADYMQREFPLSRLHRPDAMDDDITGSLAFGELGWLSSALPESAGGAGFSIVEETLIFREIGRVVGPLAPLPAVLAVKLAHDAGLHDRRDAIAAGRESVAFALADGPLDVEAGGIAGRARLYEAAHARSLLVEAGDEFFLLEHPGTRAKARDSLDRGIRTATAELSGLPILARGPAGSTWANGALLTSALLVGLAEGATAMICEYAKVRETFGRKIGAYQAVRHPIAESAARCEHAKALLHFAALAYRDGRADAEAQIRAAKIVAHRAATRAADINIQLHGAIGITEELPAHHFMKRALTLAAWFGNRKAHLDAILDAPLLTI